MQYLAAGLIQRMPWLGRSHPSNLCKILHNLSIDPNILTPQTLIEIITWRNHHLNRVQPDGTNTDNPLGLFAYQLRQSLALLPTYLHPPHEQNNLKLKENQARLRRAKEEEQIHLRQVQAQRNDPEAQARIANYQTQCRAALREIRDSQVVLRV